ncbi:PASTA domain-containing protein [Amycolatopsis sp. FBCC-B4732]|uniref:PASTA domain-containing protein n=1 Tax=Amycolatopsis sp. FBCC-B4732 TaxID=3079339 RepID=UPI001FF11F0A|nr:PASTA domain-containing protein [Amycolatopsis sp. FBCC-B4732]UOX84498.1 PASTA domain-containing protein [Amycolatopsis sp. FBCC-B4732]
MSRRMVTALAVLAFTPAACGVTPGAPGPPTVVKTATSAPAPLVKVPDVSGMNHQDAQDAMQRAGLYNLREVDGSGQGRMLVIDRNWVQTGQDPAPGTEVRADAVITLTAVKYTDR